MAGVQLFDTAKSEIDWHQHKSGAMGHRYGERPKRQLCRAYAGEKARVPAIDEQVATGSDNK